MSFTYLTFLALTTLSQDAPLDPKLVETCWNKLQLAVGLLEGRGDPATNFSDAFERERLRVRADKDKLVLYAGLRAHGIFRENGKPSAVWFTPVIAEFTPPPRDKWEGVSSEEAVEVCRSLYRLFDDRATLRVRRVTGAASYEWRILATLETEPWPLADGYECIFNVFKHGGLLHTAYLNYAPDLSLSNEPVLPIERLHAAALDAYQRWEPFGEGVIKGTKIALDRPYYGQPCDLRESDLNLAKAQKVIPVYELMIAERESVDRETGQFSTWQVVHVDARDGHVLAIAPNSLLGVTKGTSPLSGPTAGDLTVTIGGKQTVVSVEVAKSPTKAVGRACVVQQGDTLWRARWNSSKRTLVVGSKALQLDLRSASKLRSLPERPRFGAPSD